VVAPDFAHVPSCIHWLWLIVRYDADVADRRLVDQLMVPFENCYLLIYVLIFPMLAGNEALPLFLRAELWVLTKLVSKGTELDVSLHFLLAHSRR
jgi:hypothetical protein